MSATRALFFLLFMVLLAPLLATSTQPAQAQQPAPDATGTQVLFLPSVVNGVGTVPTATATTSATATATTSATATATRTATATATPTVDPIPPDPVDVAPALDPSVATSLQAASSFLYSGANPIQHGVAPGTIELQRTAVLRGKVLAGDGEPLQGVQISILDHAEFGYTVSRADGLFDMVVNGGGILVVQYNKEGFLPAQRQVKAPWQDYAWLPDVVLIPLDNKVTAVNLTSAAPVQVARGSVISDTDGSRQATVLFPQGVQAEMVLPNGVTQTLTTLNVRATEYTTGPRGPQAMPGQLPPSSGYTYAAEFSVDEALAAGALDIQFDRPLYTYVDNFLDFPVGSPVPVGYYDRSRGLWVPSPDGRIIEILAIAGGLAQVDVDGSGQAADAEALAALGFNNAERQQLATLYPVGASLWRVPMTHFSAWDHNWPFGPPPGSAPPPGGGGGGPGGGGGGGDGDDDGPDDDCPRGGSIIHCHGQVLGEAIPIAGTGHALHYGNDRVPGRSETRMLQIRLSGPTLTTPPPKRIELEIRIAGRLFQQQFTPAPNLTTDFLWDGKDAYGRSAPGWHPVTVRVGNTYDGVYQQPGVSPSFGAPSGVPITGNSTRQEVTLWSEWQSGLGNIDNGTHTLAGWSLNVHHVYDPLGGVLYLGDGGRRTYRSTPVIKRVAGGGPASDTLGDGDPATQAWLNQPQGIAVAADGTVFFSDSHNHRIRRVGPDGIITTVAGGGNPADYIGDGGPATAARLYLPIGLALGPDGSLYIVDYNQLRIRRVGPDGIITTFAGNGTQCQSGGTNPCGDGGPATAAQLLNPYAVVVGTDGAVYLTDYNFVRRVGPDGIITTVAGTGVWGDGGEGGPASAAQLKSPDGLAIGPDGSLYIADGQRILRVAPDGILTRVTGGPFDAAAITVDADSNVFFADGHRIRMVAADGAIHTIAGSGAYGSGGDEGPATAAELGQSFFLTLGPDGSLYIPSVNFGRIRRVMPALPGVPFTEVLVPAADGSELYHFNGAGRHLRTLHALTGAILYEFGYDDEGRLVTVTDGDGNVTTVERDGNGQPAAIVGPYGQRTTLAVDGNGHLSGITNPAGTTIGMTTAANGLLATLTDAGSGVHRFAYDEHGRLVRDEDAAGNVTTLARIETATGYTVTVTAAGGVTTYRAERLPTGGRRLVTTFPGGGQTVMEQGTDGTSTTTYADGTRVTVALAPDPRLGMAAPFVKSQTVTTPAGRSQTTLRTHTTTLSNPGDIFSLRALTETVTIDERTTTSLYDGENRRLTTTSPAGRTTRTILDAQGRTIQTGMVGLEPLSFTYDSRGRVASTTMGSGAAARKTTLTYDATGPAAGHLASVTDPLGRTTSFTYDSAGRTTAQTLYGGQTVAYRYDAAGSLTGVTPPGRALHAFSWSVDGLLTGYTPPSPTNGVAGAPVTYGYDGQGRLAGVTQADGQDLTLVYDGMGRPVRLNLPGGSFVAGHDAKTGDVTSIAVTTGVTLSFGYDGLLPQSESWSGPVAGSVSRTFDSALRTATRSVNNVAISLTYDPDSLLVQAGALALGRHPAHGMVISTTLGTVGDEWAYSSFGGVASYTARAGDATRYTVAYTRDKLGRIAEESETIGGVSSVFAYTYDMAGRLATVKKNGTTIHSYGYDANGNRTSGSASYDGQDRLVAVGGTAFTYTLNGELKTRTVAGQTTTYVYDALGTLVGVTLPGGDKIVYLLDGLGRRVGKRVNGVLTAGWLYDERGRVVADLDGSGAVASRFVYGSRPNLPDYLVRGAATYRILSNHLGSPRLVLDAADGTVMQRLDYDAYGNIIAETLAPGFAPIPFGFAGGLYDRHTRFTRFGVRDYDAATGRWTTRDPILFASDETNLYAYASGDPINRRDGDGMDDEPAGGGVCIIFPPPSRPISPPPLLDPHPAKPEPPIKPVPSFADMQKERQKTGGSKSSGGGGLTLGPFKFTPKPNTPSLSDIREKDPLDWFDSFDLTIEAPIYPDFSLPPKPEESGGPDPKSPDTKPQGPQCKPKLDSPDPSGCEA